MASVSAFGHFCERELAEAIIDSDPSLLSSPSTIFQMIEGLAEPEALLYVMNRMKEHLSALDDTGMSILLRLAVPSGDYQGAGYKSCSWLDYNSAKPLVDVLLKEMTPQALRASICFEPDGFALCACVCLPAGFLQLCERLPEDCFTFDMFRKVAMQCWSNDISCTYVKAFDSHIPRAVLACPDTPSPLTSLPGFPRSIEQTLIWYHLVDVMAPERVVCDVLRMDPEQPAFAYATHRALPCLSVDDTIEILRMSTSWLSKDCLCDLLGVFPDDDIPWQELRTGSRGKLTYMEMMRRSPIAIDAQDAMIWFVQKYPEVLEVWDEAEPPTNCLHNARHPHLREVIVGILLDKDDSVLLSLLDCPNSPLWRWVASPEFYLLADFVKLHPEVVAKCHEDKRGMSLLIEAAAQREWDNVEALAPLCPSEVRARRYRGRTALFYAQEPGTPANCVSLLQPLAKKADS